ncbi:uncharacterized protein LOC116428816 [Nomia melanderi]|uniref:uncharacterized protein LOC116428816 n=1 Tax=Nomia melanderi TaxID=2448451 RepID=UPI003FCDE721
MPTQSIPMQTSQNNLQPNQQPQTVTQQLQTSPVTFQANPQDTYKPFYQLHQADIVFANQQYVPNALPARNPYQPTHQILAAPPVAQTQPNYGQLPQSVVEQIRGAVSNAAPIFILPSGCHQSASHQQQLAYPSNQGGVSAPTGLTTSFNYPPSIYCPPSFVPYPIPLPLYEPFTGLVRGKEKSQGCGCCQRGQESLESRNHLANPYWNASDSEEHRCTATNDDTVCSKRNCPASISLQVLVSQFLGLQGIIPCAATRLILRKVPGSNIVCTIEETMEKAQRAIGLLTKDQLLTESRNAQQVNALINLHVTTNLPASIIPLLTLVQLKVNILKAQVESLVNKRVMECQGYGFEVETSKPIDPAILATKTDAELRQLLNALKQKECDERVNANFAPYHSQRVIAESRLNNVQAKIRQVEAEFDNRRNILVPPPTMTSRIIQQFSESRCTFGYAPAKLFEPCITPDSPDPFTAAIRNPKKLYIKPRQDEPPVTKQENQNKGTSTSEEASACKDTGTGEGNVQCPSKDQSVDGRWDTCSCDGTSSEDSLDADKKKLRPEIDRAEAISIIRTLIIKEDPCKIEDDSDHLNIEDVEYQTQCEGCESLEEGDQEKSNAESIKDTEKDDRGLTKANEDLEMVELQGESKAMADKNVRVEVDENGRLQEERVVSETTEDSKTVELPKGLVNIRVIKAARISGFARSLGGLKSKIGKGSNAQRSQKDVTNNDNSGSNNLDGINFGNDKTGQKNENKENVQIVSIMTNIKYDRSDFGRWRIMNEKRKATVNSVNEVSENTKLGNLKNQNYACLFAERINSSMLSDTNDETKHEIELNAQMKLLTEKQSMFMKDPNGHDNNVIEEFTNFPPLKQATSIVKTSGDVSRNFYRRKETEADSKKIICDRSTSDHQNRDSRNSVASVLCSMIGNRLDRFGSLLDNIPNLQTMFSHLYSNKLWSVNGDVAPSRSYVKTNKTMITGKDDWILLPTDIDREIGKQNNSRENCILMGNKLYKVRKIKHSIIRNKGNKSYVLIGGSICEQSRELSRKGFTRPSKVRRSLVIRSQLKHPERSQQDRPSPFVAFKTFKVNKRSVSLKLRQSERYLESNNKFYCSSDNLECIKAPKSITPIDLSKDSFNSSRQNEISIKQKISNVPSSLNVENAAVVQHEVISKEHLVFENEKVMSVQNYITRQQ